MRLKMNETSSWRKNQKVKRKDNENEYENQKYTKININE